MKVPKPGRKEVVVIIEYRADPEDLLVSEVLDKLRETGSAAVIDVRVEEKQ